MSKPTLVFVHGSWHSPEHFGPLINNLQSHGYKCSPVSLPSTQTPDTPPATFADDCSAIRKTVVEELDSGNNVVVIAHSYGGLPTNNALHGLHAASRSANQSKNHVQAIIFVAAAPMPPGRSFINVLGGKPGPIHDLRTEEFCWVGEPGPQVCNLLN
jgi:pimeloyl-ACP methyl ester carboxylesterase